MHRLVTCLLLTSLTAAALADNWPHWRGPHYDGSTEETDLPDTWSQTENVAWAAPLPGPGESTPIVWEDRVFLTSADRETKALHALCFSLKDGAVLWQKRLSETTRKAPNNSMACPSPVTDGKSVFFLFGTGDLAAFDLNGKALWKRDLAADFGRFSLKWGYSSSPLLFDGRLYVQMIRRETPYAWSGEGKWPTDSFLLALDPATGKDLWKQPRKTDAEDESQDAYTSPIPLQGERPQILVTGGDYVTSHDPATGKELWRATYAPKKERMWRLVPSVTPGEGIVYAGAPRGNSLIAVPADRTGTVPPADFAWKLEPSGADVCVSLLYQGRLYLLGDSKRTLYCLDPKTGEKLWEGKLAEGGRRGSGRGVFRASPTGADGKLYLMDEAGEVIVLAAGDELKVLSRVQMGGSKNRGSIAAAQGKLFIRTSEKLYCVTKSK